MPLVQLSLFPPVPEVIPDLASYDHIVLNSSAGKDSQAMLDYVHGLARDAGVTCRLVVVHADLGRMEWPGTRELAEEHAAHYGLRFEVVRRQQDLLDHIRERGMFPGPSTRYCTADHKRAQVDTLFTRLAGETGQEHGRRPRILNCLGLRADESPARAKRVPFDQGDRLRMNSRGKMVCGRSTNGRRMVDHWLPIHRWDACQVWERIRTAGTRAHYAYSLGMPRLSCVFCIYSPRPALLLAGKYNRPLLDAYVKVEQQIGHTLRVDQSLAEIAAALDAGAQPGQVPNWVM